MEDTGLLENPVTARWPGSLKPQICMVCHLCWVVVCAVMQCIDKVVSSSMAEPFLEIRTSSKGGSREFDWAMRIVWDL